MLISWHFSCIMNGKPSGVFKQEKHMIKQVLPTSRQCAGWIRGFKTRGWANSVKVLEWVDKDQNQSKYS